MSAPKPARSKRPADTDAPAPAPDHADRVVRDIEIRLIDTDAQRVRGELDDDAIDELALDIQAHGLLQPIGVSPQKDGRYELLYGSRRLAAHRRLNRYTIPATVHQITTRSIRSTALAENLVRRNLSVAEEIEAVRALAEDENLSPAQIGARIGRSRAWVLARLEIDQYPPDVRTELLDEHISIGVAQELARLNIAEARIHLLHASITGRWTVAQTRSAVDEVLRTPLQEEAIAEGVRLREHPEAQPELMIKCAACGTPRHLAELAIVRVCAAGCPPTDTEHPTTTPNGDATHGTH